MMGSEAARSPSAMSFSFHAGAEISRGAPASDLLREARGREVRHRSHSACSVLLSLRAWERRGPNSRHVRTGSLFVTSAGWTWSRTYQSTIEKVNTEMNDYIFQLILYMILT